MPRVEFLHPFDWTDPRLPLVITVYKAGRAYLVTTPCAKAAISAGRARPIEAPNGSASYSGRTENPDSV